MFGFIGVGNMGGAVAAAVCKGAGADKVFLCNRTAEKAERLAGALGCAVTDNQTAVKTCRYLFLGVKPQNMKELLEGLRPTLQETKPVLVSMAAGLTATQIEEMAGGNIPVMRIMPNTPVAIGCGVIMYCKNALLTAEDEQVLVEALSPAGIVDPLEERLMDAGSALCGCSPAFTDLYMEAMADGAVAEKIFFKKFFCGISHCPNLSFERFTEHHGTTAAVDNGTDTDYGIIADISVLSHF